MIKLGAEEEAETKKVRITITLPTKEKIVKALTAMFPGIEVEVEEEKPTEERPSEE